MVHKLKQFLYRQWGLRFRNTVYIVECRKV